jgi:hypothetical protein
MSNLSLRYRQWLLIGKQMSFVQFLHSMQDAN